jgi:hypothetical protein
MLKDFSMTNKLIIFVLIKSQIKIYNMKTFTLDQVLDLLCSMQQAITPEAFKSSSDLDTIDFLDLPLCKASELGIKDEFESFMDSNENYTETFSLTRL